MKRITIIGAGNGGQAIAGYCAAKGYDVCLYNRSSAPLEALNATGYIQLCGAIDMKGKVDFITQDIRKAVEFSNLILIVTTATAHHVIAEQVVPFLTDNHTIVLNPGRTFGALEFGNILKRSRPNLKCRIAEAQTLVFACRIISNGLINIIGVKDKVLLSGRNSQETEVVHSIISRIFPCFVKAKSLLETGMLNVGAIFHPSIVLFNAATIERNEQFYFYREMTPQIARCIEQLDDERLRVSQAFKLDLMPVREWIKFAYPSTVGTTLCERMRNNPAYYEIKAPGSIFTRQLTEDIPTGLLPMSELGKVAGVKTPLMDSFISISEALLNEDFTLHGRTLKNMGLLGMNVQQIISTLS